MADSVKGMSSLLKKLHRLGDAKEIDAITEGVSMEIQLDAVQRAPVDLGKLRQSIYQRRVSDKTYQVVVGVNYGPFVEFGTGPQVKVPAELSTMALKFKGGVSLKTGMRPQPYLYPAFVKGRLQYIKDLEQYLKELTK